MSEHERDKINLTDDPTLQDRPVLVEVALDETGWLALYDSCEGGSVLLSAAEALKLLDVLKANEAAIRAAMQRPMPRWDGADEQTVAPLLPPYEG